MYCKVVFDVPLDRDFDYQVPQALESQVMPGIRVTAPFGRVLTTGLVTAVSAQTTLQKNILIKEIASVLDEKPLFGSDLFALAHFMQQTWGGPIGQILFSLVPPQPYFKLLPAPDITRFTPLQNPPALLTPQLKQLTEWLSQGFHSVLLCGPAGSGKTRHILHLAHTVLQHYGQALLTLPDVWAAQQWMEELQTYFGADWVVGWHSKMLLSQKKQIFSRISNGIPTLVVSARSGGLLPFKNLRLAAILEEESDQYKQEENKPYFHLRDLLRLRAKQHEALFILSSDTPCLESLHEVSKGQSQCIELPSPGPAQTNIQITPKKGESSAILSEELLQHLQNNLHAQQASLLILNRRGYASAYACLNCGAYAKCKKCGAILAREKDGAGQDRLVCKKCGHLETLEQTCPQCQNKIFKSRGGGTQKVVTELLKFYPQARILRLDSDTLKTKTGQGHQIRQALAEAQADIIVGTRQALSCIQEKRITLAAIVDADLELDSPDFRASEHFAQLLFKLKNHLAFRPQSRLLVQASSADIFPFELLKQPYTACAQEELAARESFSYPPFVQLIKVTLKSKDTTLLEAETARLMSHVTPLSSDVLGPVKTGKKTDTFKKQYILLKVSPANYLPLMQVLQQYKPSPKTDIKIIADPYDFY